MHLDTSPLLGLRHGLLLALPLLASLPQATTASRPPSKDAILLSTVRTLTLRSPAQTTSRRVAPVDQLTCVSRAALCALAPVELMRCTNEGSSYGGEDVEWSCTATLPSTLRLGSTDVVCEGYRSRDDEYVLKGSCAVEYRLVLTEEGERRYPDLAAAGEGGAGGWGWGWFADETGRTDWGAVAFWCVLVAVLAWIGYSACFGAGGNARRRGRRIGDGRGGWGWGGGGGGGGGPGPGWGPGHDPPPPYPGTKPSGQQGWQPGFWTGLASGAAAGYMAGGNRNYGNDYGYYGRRNRRSGWGGAGPSRSSDGGSSSRYESTGFGSTSRR